VGICCPAELDPRVAAVDPAQLLEALQECSVTGLRFPVVRSQAHYDADAPRALALLRLRRQRPCSHSAAEQRDELAPSHSIPSAARPTSEGGRSSPSALPALRLTTSSNLTGNCTGSSPGFSLLRMRSA